MLAEGKAINRTYVGEQFDQVIQLPNLIDIQLLSFESFLQKDKLSTGQPAQRQGLEDVFQSVFPIESPSGDMLLEYVNYTLEEESIRSEFECKQKGLTYSVTVKAKINLVFLETGEIRQKNIYIGDIPLMTDRGTFIINGAERVVVSQIHRSPGVIFSYEKGVFSSRIIPYRGSWLEFEIDQKKELIYTKIDRKKRILGTLFLRALGYDSREKILELYYKSRTLQVVDKREEKDELVDSILFKDVYAEREGETKKIYRAGDKLHPHEIDDLIHTGVEEIEVIDFEHAESLHSQVILRCFEIEESKHTRTDAGFDEPTKEDALVAVYSVLMPGEPISLENAEKDLNTMFFTERRYDLGRVGRYKLNKKFDYVDPEEHPILRTVDIVNTMRYLIQVYIGEANVDDIDHLGNRRIRSVGELLQNSLKTAFSRMERVAKERMNLDTERALPQELIS
ncbi:MAG: DNA-directed RNA polymerase subunit beta, partial [Spirochaetales bacterium]|nr:DNA-directed RNA polymerase subunit beta [Spirochaetales bacterium]